MPEHPWEPMEGETAKAFEAFGYYRRLAPSQRSLQQAWEDYWSRPGNALQRSNKDVGRPYGHWTRWMSKWRWQERARAWDAEQAEIRARARQRARGSVQVGSGRPSGSFGRSTIKTPFRSDIPGI